MLCKPAPLDSVLGRLVGSIGGAVANATQYAYRVCMQSKHAVSDFLMGLGTVQTGEPP